MDEGLIKILKEAKKQRGLNSWIEDYQPKQNQADSALDSSYVHHLWKNDTDEQPIDIDDSDWEELLEEERLFKI